MTYYEEQNGSGNDLCITLYNILKYMHYLTVASIHLRCGGIVATII